MQAVCSGGEIVCGEVYHLQTYKVRFNKKRILNSLDCYESSDIYEEVNELYEELKEVVEKAIKPNVVFKVEDYASSATNINELEGHKQAIYVTTTLGEEITQEINKGFAEFDYMKAMLIDAMGTSVLFDIGDQFYKIIYDYIYLQNMGVTVLSPGESNVPISYQRIIEEKIGQFSGVYVTEGFLLEPMKSVSKIYGLKEGLELPKTAHNCKRCNDTTCKWRVVNYEG